MPTDFKLLTIVQTLRTTIPTAMKEYERERQRYLFHHEGWLRQNLEPLPTEQTLAEDEARCNAWATILEDEFRRLGIVAATLIKTHGELADGLKLVRWNVRQSDYEELIFDAEMRKIENALVADAVQVVTITSVADLAKRLNLPRQRVSSLISEKRLPPAFCEIRNRDSVEVHQYELDQLYRTFKRRSRNIAKVSPKKTKRPEASVRSARASGKSGRASGKKHREK